MRIKYPVTIDTPQKKTAFLYRLYELVRVEGNTNKWNNPKFEEAIETILHEVNIQRELFKKDNTNPATTQDIEGY